MEGLSPVLCTSGKASASEVYGSSGRIYSGGSGEREPGLALSHQNSYQWQTDVESGIAEGVPGCGK